MNLNRGVKKMMRFDVISKKQKTTKRKNKANVLNGKN